jgi:hypothetical protein
VRFGPPPPPIARVPRHPTPSWRAREDLYRDRDRDRDRDARLRIVPDTFPKNRPDRRSQNAHHAVGLPLHISHPSSSIHHPHRRFPQTKSRVDDIRAKAESPGLRDYEASLLRLLDKLTNGMAVEINESGTALKYKPGVVVGGRRVTHDCGGGRAVGYFLEAVLCVSLFAKKPLDLTLTGITNDECDISVDTFRTITLPMMKRNFGCDEGLSLTIVRRGAPPGANGEINVKLPILKELKLLDWTDEGLVKRVRGVAFTLRLSPQTGNRLVDAARGVLNKFLPDVYVPRFPNPGTPPVLPLTRL